MGGSTCCAVTPATDTIVVNHSADLRRRKGPVSVALVPGDAERGEGLSVCFLCFGHRTQDLVSEGLDWIRNTLKSLENQHCCCCCCC